MYQNALAFLYPSFYEGFGLPILEAMKCGTPVLTSDATSMPEVADNAAYFVNPNEPDSIKQGMHKLYRDEVFRAQLIEKGYERVKKFSWQKAVKTFLELA